MLLSLEQCLGFLSAAILITLAPGPDNLMVLGMGITRGRRAGMAFGLGCALGCLSHTLLAAIGVSAMIAASALAFGTLKLLGGAYLVWLGLNALRHRGAIRIPGQSDNASLGHYFARGCLANAINPKVILFFLAFLPQFVIAPRGHGGLQIVQLGLLFVVQACVLFAALGYFSGGIGSWLQQRPRAGIWLDSLAGSLFVLLGLKLLVSG